MILKTDEKKEYQLNVSACSVFKHSNLSYTIRDCSISETFKTISLSSQELIEKFKPVVIENEKLKHRDNTKPIALSALLVNQDSKSDVTVKLHDF